jgi:hypothetical protein
MSNGSAGPAAASRGPRIALWLVLLAALGFWIALAVRGGFLTIQAGGPVWLWVLSIIVTTLLLVLAGHEINDQWFGVLIDTRNKLSLARLQITLWTVLVLTAYLTIALGRILAMMRGELTQAQALDITFPQELILAMGISAASFTGSSLIKRTKESRTTTIEAKSTPDSAQKRRDQAKAEFDAAEAALLVKAQDEANKKQALAAATAAVAAAPDAVARAAAQAQQAVAQTLHEAALQDKDKATKDREEKKKTLDATEQDLVAVNAAQGLLHRNADPSQASWVDLFRGEEIGNYKLVDMSKVQMLFFTVVVIATYAAGIVGMLMNTNLLSAGALSFPPFDNTLNALLGISHGTYLSVKAVDHS